MIRPNTSCSRGVNTRWLEPGDAAGAWPLLSGVAVSHPRVHRVATARDGGFVVHQRLKGMAHPFHDPADALCFMKRLVHDLPHRIWSRLRASRMSASLFDFVQIKEQRGQRIVELVRHRGAHFIHRPHPCSGHQIGFQLIELSRGIIKWMW